MFPVLLNIDVVANDSAVGTEDLEFDSRVGQIGRIVANGSPPLQCSLGTVLSRR